MKRAIPLIVVAGLGLPASPSAVECIDPSGQCPRPVEFGVSGLNINDACTAGTLGALLDIGSARVILSNNHVLARENAGEKGVDRIVQPGPLDNSPQCAQQQADSVGILVHFIPIDFSGSNNVFDMAFAATNGSLTDTTGRIARIGLVSPAPFPGVPAIGTLVKKHGRTTGLTFGQISAVNVTSNVSYSTGVALFRNQYRVTPGSFSDGGDSGSLIVEDAEVCPRAVGLLFAGSDFSTLANPLNQFLAFTGFQVVGDASCPPSAAVLRAPGVDIRRAMQIQADHEAALLASPGVVGMGVSRSASTNEPVLEVYVESVAVARSALPSSIEGMPVRVVVTGPFVAY